MGAAEIAVRRRPLPIVAARFGVPLATEAGGRQSGDPPGGAAPAGRVPLVLTAGERRNLRAVAIVAAHWPFSEGPCLRQALAVGLMLRPRQPVLRVGAALSGDEVMGHAWVEVAGTTIGDVAGFGVLSGDGS